MKEKMLSKIIIIKKLKLTKILWKILKKLNVKTILKKKKIKNKNL